MKKKLASTLTALTLTAALAPAQALESLPAAPSDQELIELQTEEGLRRLQDQTAVWSILDVLKPRNQCKYAIQVPDSITRGTISLTFDDGPNPSTTPLILDVLKAHNAKAVFFILGSKVKGNESIIRRMVEEGHHIANHSYSHPNFHTLDSKKTRNEILTTDKLLRQFAEPVYFRYPYGNANCNGNEIAASMGYSLVGWDIDTCDWAYSDGQVSDRENATCQAPQSLRSDYAGYVLKQVEKTQGGVLLMHDIHKNTAHSLDRMMTLLEQKGYRFVSLDDHNIYPKLNRR